MRTIAPIPPGTDLWINSFLPLELPEIADSGVRTSELQVWERRLNLNRSWYKDHSRAYNTPFFLSRLRRICLLQYLRVLLSPTPHHFHMRSGPCKSYDLGPKGLGLLFITWEKLRIATFSRDSGLEAFSPNPTHGSFSALTFQSTDLPIMWTNGSSRTKLDYCRGDLSSVG